MFHEALEILLFLNPFNFYFTSCISVGYCTINSENISDRYYVALYKKMLEPDLKYTAKQAMFLNLLFKSLKKDVVERRVKVSKT